MEQRAHAASAGWQARLASSSLGVVLACIGGLRAALPQAADGTLSPRELQILGGAIAFMQPPPAGGPIAVVYATGDPASRRNAEALAGEMGNGLKVGSLLLPAKVVDASALAAGGFAMVIVATGANGSAVGAAARAAHILCVTADLAAVQAGTCTLGIRTEPRVELVLNRAAAAASGIEFPVALRMMIHEI
jgi:hypothetical protein